MSNTLIYLMIRPNNCSYTLQDGFGSGCLGFLDSNFILEFYDYSGVEMFSWNRKNSRLRCSKNIEELFFANHKSVMCIRVQWVRSTAATTNRTDIVLCKVRESVGTCVPFLTAERKRNARLSRRGKCFWGRISLRHLEDLLFRYAPILLPVRSLLRNWYSCIYLIHFFVL